MGGLGLGAKTSTRPPKLTQAAQLPMIVNALKGDTNRRLAAMEKAIANFKDLRLEVPCLKNDLEELQKTVQGLASCVEDLADGNTSFSAGDVEASFGAGDEPKLRPVPSFATLPGINFTSEGPEAEDRAGMGASALAPSDAGGVGPSLSVPSTAPRRSTFTAAVAFNRRAGMDNESKELLIDLQKKVETLIDGSSDTVVDGQAGRKVQLEDMWRLLKILEDRVKELDGSYRPWQKKVDGRLEHFAIWQKVQDDEDLKCNKAWNLEHQVDVILSLVKSEMVALKADLSSSLASAGGAGVGDSSPPRRLKPSTAKFASNGGGVGSNDRLGEIEEKLRKLSDSYQQLTLKSTGLRAALRHADIAAQSTNERVKRIVEDFEPLLESTQLNSCNIDYLTLQLTNQGGMPSYPNGQLSFVAATQLPRKALTAIAAAGNIQRGPHGRRRSAGLDEARFESGGSATLGTPHPSPARRSHTSRTALVTDVPGEGAVEEGRNSFSAGSGAGAAAGSVSMEQQVEMNAGRLLRLGKKVSDLDGEVTGNVQTLQGELHMVSQKLSQIIAFLPKRQRRLVEKIIFEGTSKGCEEGPEDEPSPTKKKSMVGFKDDRELVEIKSFDVPEDMVMPWQMVSEPDQQWSWCRQPLTEMGRELARHLEQMDHEKAEFEKEVSESFERLREEMEKRVSASSLVGANMPQTPGTPARRRVLSTLKTGEQAGGATGVEWDSAEGEGTISRIDEQIAFLNDRLLKAEKELSRSVKDAHGKVDREEFNLVALRISSLNGFDHLHLMSLIESLQGDQKLHEQMFGEFEQKIRSVEASAAQRADLTKVRGEVSSMKLDVQKVSHDVKDATYSIAFANKHHSSTLSELRGSMERYADMLKEKTNTKDFGELLDKVRRLEHGMTDNRQILSAEGGAGMDINGTVKRILLNLEDKIMVLEKKVDALAEGKPVELSMTSLDALAVAGAAFAPKPEAKEMHALSTELQNVGEVVQQLKRDLSMSKVEIEHITEQGNQQSRLAERLSVAIGEAAGTGGADESMVLSLNRVQLMVAAAARQLVAGSKWITKETFDMRVGELRKEFATGIRSHQAALEELEDAVNKVAIPWPHSALPSTAAGNFAAGESAPPSDGSPRLPRGLSARRNGRPHGMSVGPPLHSAQVVRQGHADAGDPALDTPSLRFKTAPVRPAGGNRALAPVVAQKSVAAHPTSVSLGSTTWHVMPGTSRGAGPVGADEW
mmetsp:Transcript_41329/g.133191  ORF Transcript_41329/g.133191 Transcript_41329/m.133191 type:complete len:1226 (+) Transcript_41329:460-4137(+)